MKDMVQVRRSGRPDYSGPDAKIGRSQFNRSHGLKTTFNASYLIPILVDEVLPGDTFTCKLNGFARVFSPLDAPIMDNIELETSFWYCPTRLLWNHWEEFNGAHGDAGIQDTTYTIPVLQTGVTVNHDPSGGTAIHSLSAYMGLPHGLTTSTNSINSLPFRMYQFVYNEWFRDQNLIDLSGQTTADEGHQVDDGPSTISVLLLEKSAKKHDYFTSCLPYLQKGTAVAVAADVVGDPAGDNSLGAPRFTASDSTPSGVVNLVAVESATEANVDVAGAWTAGQELHWLDPQLIANVDINALRQSVAIQRLLERDARGGTRYTEVIKAHFGVTVPDYRLQRPEYLGGGKSYINISPVANTSATAGQDQGELAGVGTGIVAGHAWAKSFVEHGYILGLVRARGDVTYFQGIDRMWSRSTRYDFYIPALANLGEQSVLNQEIFWSGDANDALVFGYQERWAEYRTKMSRISGNFVPDVSGAISHWHLAEDFSALPTLNQTFVEDATPMSRVTTVDTEEDFILDIWFDYKCARPIPVNSVPSLVGRF